MAENILGLEATNMSFQNDTGLLNVTVTMIDDEMFEFENVNVEVWEIRDRMNNDIFELEDEEGIYFFPREKIKSVVIEK